MWGWAWVQFEAIFGDINFSINENLEINKTDGGDIFWLKISWYNEWTLDVDNYYKENWGGEYSLWCFL